MFPIFILFVPSNKTPMNFPSEILLIAISYKSCHIISRIPSKMLAMRNILQPHIPQQFFFFTLICKFIFSIHYIRKKGI